MVRKTILLDKGWKFCLNEDVNANFKGFDDSSWDSVTVPHDWSIKGAFSTDYSSGTGYVRGGIGWYRLRFDAKECTDKRVYITFDGIYNNSMVWINSNYLGKRPYGYSTFTYDISEFVTETNNVVSVKVNHSETADSRWFTGSGITRKVYLTITDKTCIKPFGVFVTTPKISKDCAEVNISVSLEEDATIRNTILDNEGNIIASGETDTLTVSNPKLWSPDSPYLYKVKSEVIKNNQVVDDVCTTFGIRYFSFDPDKGFECNGQNMKLKGVCLHHDAGCLGAAVPKCVWKRRLEKIKKLGCNAIRTSHNPPDVELLDLCDEMGFFVMDEAFDEWEGPKNKWWQGHNVYPPKHFGYYEDFPTWGEKDIKTMVMRDRNHPSIIIWSIGNEVDYPNDPYVHPLFEEMTGNNDSNKPAQERQYNPDKPNAKRLASIAKMLTKYVKECDSTRPVTAAIAFPELSVEIGYMQAVDIAGYNYKEHLYEEHHKRFKNTVFYGSENGHSKEAWDYVKNNDYMCGQFLWTGVDYLGETRLWPSRGSGSGLLDIAGNEKALYYQRLSFWSDEATLTLLVQNKNSEPIRSYYGEEGEEITVVCYTNCDDATLFVNGKSLGTSEDSTWTFPYEKGEIEVVATKDGKEIRDSLKSVGEAVKIHTESIIDNNIAQIEVSLLDENNLVCPIQRKVGVVASENCEIMGLESGDLSDFTAYFERFRNTKNGKLIIYARFNGDASINISCTGLPNTIVKL